MGEAIIVVGEFLEEVKLLNDACLWEVTKLSLLLEHLKIFSENTKDFGCTSDTRFPLLPPSSTFVFAPAQSHLKVVVV